jgi:hypothetical protein
MTNITFVDLHSVPAPDPTKEKVVGVIVNKGDKAVSKMSIRVEGLDASGAVLTSAVTPPLDQTIDPLGGRATFEAFLPRNDAVRAYHAVALAK